MGPNNPPLEYPGEALVMLDTEGRLMFFRSIPTPVQSNKGIIQPLDWALFFAEAGLDIKNWDETNDLWYPPSHADIILVWQGTLSNYTDALTRVKAAAFSGNPFYFEIIAPWNQTSSVEQTQQPIQSKKFFTAGVALTFFFAAAGVF